MSINSYDFLNLSYIEFEELVKDLYEREIQLPLESFAIGPDAGIDLRCFINNKEQLVIQCKRMKNFADLFAVLKKEKTKIVHLKNHRYILATSVDLTISQKDKIHGLLKENIRTPADILGRKDLNSLLRRHKVVEQQHFKLWITSTNVLETVLNSKAVNQSRFELERIKELLTYYVATPSLTKALKILKKERFLIISGNPGVGKTSLARVLSFHYLSKVGYHEFVFLSASIDEAYSLYKPGVKQVFFYDDFLGQNFEERRLQRNEDKRFIEFIRQIKYSHDKILICTTREYILNAACQKYEPLKDFGLDMTKFILDLNQTSYYLKARILYNLLITHNLSRKLLASFSNPDAYYHILRHRNFNPRLIANSIRFAHKMRSGTKIIEIIHQNLDKPISLWENAYNEQISKFSQFLLLVLLTMKGEAIWEDAACTMHAFIQKYGKKYKLNYSEIEFRKSVRELEGSFITSEQDVNNKIAIKFRDPSVLDFLLLFFNDHQDILRDVLSAATFFNQLFDIFENQPIVNIGLYYSLTHGIKCDTITNQIRIDRIISKFDTLKYSNFSPSHENGPERKPTFIRHDMDVFERLDKLQSSFKSCDPIQYKIINEFVLSKLVQHYYQYLKNLYRILEYIKPFDKKFRSHIVDIIAFSHNRNCYKYPRNLDSFLRLTKTFKDKLELDAKKIIELIYARDFLFYERYYDILQELFPVEHHEYISDPTFRSELERNVYSLSVELGPIGHIVDIIMEFSKKYGINVNKALQIAELKKKAFDNLIENLPNLPVDYFMDEHGDVRNLFNNLLK